ncbi:MAG: hypothetical protein LBP85_10185 [Prevotellaceae bacterium]|nr:hypothetical protein [Prevotellaceae bacterium]
MTAASNTGSLETAITLPLVFGENMCGFGANLSRNDASLNGFEAFNKANHYPLSINILRIVNSSCFN